ncbi:MAG: hypothetical protein HWE24_06535 [Oceanospirillaceae bacterium]|nr:hypothetical protein [Oceanospirillaceae bacterium]
MPIKIRTLLLMLFAFSSQLFAASPLPPAPSISLPSTSTGTFFISWTGTGVAQESELWERKSGEQWKRIQTLTNRNSTTLSKSQAGNYQYKVRYCLRDSETNSRICSPYSSDKTISIQHPPGSPSNLHFDGLESGEARDGYINLDWYGASGTVKRYKIKVYYFDSYQSEIVQEGSVSRYISERGAHPSGIYRFSVRACNDIQCGTPVTSPSVTVIGQPPNPRNLSFNIDNHSGNVSLEWDWSGDTYTQRYRLSKNYAGANLFVANINPDFPKVNYTISDVQNGSWEYQLQTCNYVCSEGIKFNIDILRVPSPINDLQISNTEISEDGSVALSWSYNLDEVIDSFVIYEKREGVTCGNEEEFCEVASYPKSLVNGELTLLDREDGEYSYKISACNNSGCSVQSESVGPVTIRKSLSFIVPDEEITNLTVPQREVIGSIDETAGVSAGEASYTLELEVPAGRAGVTPSLTLNYDSGASNGVLGSGWTLSGGAHTITRCSTSLAVHGYSQAFKGVLADQLCLDGKLLLLNSGQQGYPGSKYTTELNNHSSIELLDGDINSSSSRFVVTYKNGTSQEFNTISNNLGYPTSWGLSLVKDLHGNRIDYFYTESSSIQTALERIVYTGHNDTRGGREIVFLYEDSQIGRLTFTSGGEHSWSSRKLRFIETLIDGELQDRYTLSYVNSEYSKRELLSSVERCRFGLCSGLNKLPATNIEYYTASNDFNGVKLFGTQGDGFVEYRVVGDFDGDGFKDKAKYYNEPLASTPSFLGINLSSIGHIPASSINNALPNIFSSTFGSKLIHNNSDINQDGKSNLYTINENGMLEILSWSDSLARFEFLQTDLFVENPAGIVGFIDINNDGALDIRLRTSNGVDVVRLNCTENKRFVRFCDNVTIPEAEDNSVYFFKGFSDWNGDGVLDANYSAHSNFGLTTRNSIIRLGNIDNGHYSIGDELLMPVDLRLPNLKVVDVNSDGLPDILVQKYASGLSLEPRGLDIYLNKGNFSLPIGNVFHQSSTTDGFNIPKHLFQSIIPFDYDSDGILEFAIPSLLVTDWCYTEFQQIGNQVEDRKYCSSYSGIEGNRYGFEQTTAYRDFGIYRHNIVRLLPKQNLGFDVEYEESNIVLPAFNSESCDSNDDSVADFCYRLQMRHAASFNDVSEPYMAGQYTGMPLSDYGTYTLRQSLGANVADRLKKTTNGLGISNEWKFSSLNGSGDPECSTSTGLDFYSVNFNSAHDLNRHNSTSRIAVSRFSKSNGTNEVEMNHECYFYKDAMTSLRGRGFQGFREIASSELHNDGKDMLVITKFRDDYPFTGSVDEVKSYLLSDSTLDSPLSAQKYEYQVHSYPSGSVSLLRTVERSKEFDLHSRELVKEEVKRTTFNSGNDIFFGNPSLIESVERLYIDGQQSIVQSTNTEFQYDYSYLSEGWTDKVDFETSTFFSTSYSGALQPFPEVAHANYDKEIQHRYYYSADGTRTIAEKQSISVDTDPRSTVYGYDEYGNTVSVRRSSEGRHRVELNQYTSDGYFVSESRSTEGLWTSVLTHDMYSGMPLESLSSDGVAQSMEYDPFGNLYKKSTNQAPDLYFVAQSCTNLASCYSGIYRKTEVQDGQPISTTYHDLHGRVVAKKVVTNDTGVTLISNQQYNARGQLISESGLLAEGVQTSPSVYEYDALGRVILKEIDRSGHLHQRETWQYDYQGARTYTINPDGSEVQSVNGLDGGVLSVIDPNGYKVHNRYDALGNLIYHINDSGESILQKHDVYGNVTETIDTNTINESGFSQKVEYDGFNQVKQKITSNGDIIDYQYDYIGRLIERKINGQIESRWVYSDSAGNNLIYSEKLGDFPYRINYFYDSLNRLSYFSEVVEGQTYTTELAYDSYYGRLKGKKLPNGSIILYRHNAYGVVESEGLLQEQGPLWFANVIGYDDLGNASVQEYSNGVIEERSYFNSSGFVSSIKYSKQNGEVIFEQKYEYDDAYLNLTAIDDVKKNVRSLYDYDIKNRISNWTVNSALDPSVNQEATYRYSENGNLTFKSDSFQEYRYGDISRTNNSLAGPHAITGLVDLNGQQIEDFQYDSAGNMLSGFGRTMTYDVFNRTKSIVSASDTSIYNYTNEGALLSHNENGIVTLYLKDGHEIQDPSGRSEFKLGSAVSVVNNSDVSELRFSFAGYQGSLALIMSQEGEIISEHRFDPFGKPLLQNWAQTDGLLHPTEEESELSDRGYTGHLHNDSHKVIHMGGRVYDPLAARFMSADPVIQSPTSTQSFNGYSYVMNNPMNASDPSGYVCIAEGRSYNCTDPEGEDALAVRFIRGEITNGREFENATIVTVYAVEGENESMHALSVIDTKMSVSDFKLGTIGDLLDAYMATGSPAGAPVVKWKGPTLKLPNRLQVRNARAFPIDKRATSKNEVRVQLLSGFVAQRVSDHPDGRRNVATILPVSANLSPSGLDVNIEFLAMTRSSPEFTRTGGEAGNRLGYSLIGADFSIRRGLRFVGGGYYMNRLLFEGGFVLHEQTGLRASGAVNVKFVGSPPFKVDGGLQVAIDKYPSLPNVNLDPRPAINRAADSTAEYFTRLNNWFKDEMLGMKFNILTRFDDF